MTNTNHKSLQPNAAKNERATVAYTERGLQITYDTPSPETEHEMLIRGIVKITYLAAYGINRYPELADDSINHLMELLLHILPGETELAKAFTPEGYVNTFYETH